MIIYQVKPFFRIRGRDKVNKLVNLTGYSVEKCKSILAFFNYDYDKAKKQFLKFLTKKEVANTIQFSTIKLVMHADCSEYMVPAIKYILLHSHYHSLFQCPLT